MKLNIYLTILPTWSDPPTDKHELLTRCDLRQECMQIAKDIEKELNNVLEQRKGD